MESSTLKTTKKKPTRRRKIRSLVSQNKTESTSSNSCKLIMFSGCLLFIGFVIGSYSSHISIRWSDFLASYRSHYNLLVHGDKDYCLPIINVENLFSSIRKKVINQETALATMELELKHLNESKFIALAIAGASGVGKSLFVHELMLNFPWKENIQSETFSIHNFVIGNFLGHLSDCGVNLVIIDNFEPNDTFFIEKYNKKLYEKTLEQVSVNLLVVYVINIPTYTHVQKKLYNITMEEVQLLRDVKIVEFRKFNLKDAQDCIRHESKSLNLTLNDEDFEEISKMIDPKSSGCKNVYSKVLMYGNKKSL